MENASKALIIAGAILLAILLITLGILVYNQAAGVINNDSMNAVEMQQFNQQFIQYEGEQRGVTIRSLLQAVLANNSSADSDERKVTVTGDFDIAIDDTDISTELRKVQTGSTYTVACSYREDGLVDEIEILPTQRKPDRKPFVPLP